MFRSLMLTVSGLFLALPVWGDPVLSEFMADNASTIADENGDFSDWIEVHNPGSTAFALGGWYLTDSASNLVKWQFPAVTLQPGEFLIVWASSKNRRVPGVPLHTNFSLSKSGEFLALVRPDGTTAEQSFAPTYPAQTANVSYGPRFTTTKLLAANATGRYKIPTSETEPATTWNQPGFDESTWSSGPGGFGFGISAPGITVRQVSKNGPITSLSDALNLIARPANDPIIASSTTAVFETVNFLGDGSDGHYGLNQILPGGGGTHYVAVATGYITIPVAGVYTFGINSDDGGRILIDGAEIVRDEGIHSTQDAFGTMTLTAGVHSFRAIQFNGTAGDCFEFFAAPGTFTQFDAAAFRLVGDVAGGGLATSSTPSGTGGLVGTDLTTAMVGSTNAYVRIPFSAPSSSTATTASLVMRYNDGFAAWLNGSAVATANAPAGLTWNSAATAVRTSSQSLSRRGFNITSGLPFLTSPSNLLAIQGLNSSTTDPTFLICPEIIVGNLNTTATPVFYGGGLATPGWINGEPSSLGNVADTKFSVARGFFTAPITVAITSTTPGAVIRYTTNGSTPTNTNGTLYTAPLTISTTTVLRARATLAGWAPTNTDTQTYFFPNDIITQSADGSPPPGWPASSGTDQALNFGMDPEIVNHPEPDIGGPASVKAALLAIPSISISTDLSNLFDIDGSQGIYSHPTERGFAWERPVSMEWITPPNATYPTGKGEFQINAGMRIRGGYSRVAYNPKHSLRFFFREEYGSSKLRYPLFGRDAAQEFDKFDLRTAQNYAWSFFGDSNESTFLREEASRQAMIDMGQPGSHVRYVHLYLNGQYWGLYDIDERTEAAFAEAYLGGKREEYDVIKCEPSADWVTGVTDGNLLAWQDLWTQAKAHRAAPTNANYFRMMGLAADGVTPTTEPVLLDTENLIDYMLVTFWTGNTDGCTSAFFGEDKANNWFGCRRRVGNQRKGFVYYVHDFEHALFNINEDRTGPFIRANEADFSFSNPMFLHQDLLENAEYRMRWADRVHRHLFNDGQLTSSAWQNRINKLAAFVEPSIIAESARWGDEGAFNTNSITRTKQTWLGAQNRLLDYLTPRNPIVLDQLRADNLYPSLDAPTLSPYGGHQPNGAVVSVQGPTGAALHYMADGSDPRAVGGAVRPGALVYAFNNTDEILIPFSASGWRYLANGSDQGSAWRSENFNDSSWSNGTAEIGYGDGDEATVIPIVDVNPLVTGIQKAATCYFRKSFTVTDASQISSLALKVEYDDAFVVYLNGTRVAGNLPIDPAYDYYTGGNSVEDEISNSNVPPGLLRDELNTICIEIHQANPTSSDLSMNLSLEATRTLTATPLTLTGIGERTLRFRSRSGTTWSALAESTYQIGTALPTAADLVISEISCFPQFPNSTAEFIELLNTGTTILDLGSARFVEGIDFTFLANTNLPPGGRILVVKDIPAFELLYGTGRSIAGIFKNNTGLSKTGERLRLEAADGSPLLDFTYGTGFPWPASVNGRSMVLINPSDPAAPQSWRPGAVATGSPGTNDSISRVPGQSLLDYALGGTQPVFDTGTGNFSVTRRLGADAAALNAEWSVDLNSWSSTSLNLIGETPDAAGNSTLRWKLDPAPVDKAFIRLKVAEKP